MTRGRLVSSWAEVWHSNLLSFALVSCLLLPPLFCCRPTCSSCVTKSFQLPRNIGLGISRSVFIAWAGVLGLCFSRLCIFLKSNGASCQSRYLGSPKRFFESHNVVYMKENLDNIFGTVMKYWNIHNRCNFYINSYG